MSATVVRFADGVLVEVAQSQDRAEPVSGKAVERTAEAFQRAAETVGTTLKSVITSVHRAVRESGAASAELELGIGFSLEGNVFVSKVSADANLVIKVTLDGNRS